MNELKMPSIEEMAKIVYEFCKTNNITYIREDVLVRRIVDENTNNSIQNLKENYDLDENEWEKDKKASDTIVYTTAEVMLFTYSMSHQFYEVINILIEECKADRKRVNDNDYFEYITFYLTENEIEGIKFVRSTIEILAKQLYDYCKINDIKCMEKEDLCNIMNIIDDEDFNDRINVLVNKDMAKLVWKDNNCYIIFYLTENEIQLKKNLKALIEVFAKEIYDYCKRNDIECIEENELCHEMNIDSKNDEFFDEAKKYLKVHHMARTYFQDDKTYIQIF